ncbi:MAG: hypothetical protein NVSMB18_34680 [Acetobacteraceae bacterium]
MVEASLALGRVRAAAGHAAASRTAFIEYDNGVTGSAKGAGAGQTGNAGADEDDVQRRSDSGSETKMG